MSAVEVKNLFNFTLPALTAEMVSLGESKFRSKQLFAWIYQKHVLDFDQMSDISKNFRAILKRDYCLTLPTVFKRQDSEDGTLKLLLEMSDGAKVETVLMRYNYGNVMQGSTGGTSSQLGSFRNGWAVDMATGEASGDVARSSRLPVRLVRPYD